MHHTKATPPVPLPRKQRCPKTKSLDEELLRSNCSPESPAEPAQKSPLQTKPPPVLPKKKMMKQNSENIQTLPMFEKILESPVYEKILEKSPHQTKPPPVLPKKKMMKQNSENIQTLPMFEEASDAPEHVEVIKDLENRVSWMVCQERPVLPAKPPKRELDFNNDNQKKESLSSRNISWKECLNDLKNKEANEKETIVTLAEYLYEEIQKYNGMMSEHSDSLKKATDELHCIVANLNKVSKGTKIAGITGGATTVLGGVAAAAGVILSPFTLGSSLALTAVGVGVAAAGGLTGASAAIANKANLSSDEKKIQQTLKNFEDCYEKILSCLMFINEGMDELKLYGRSTLSETRTHSEKASNVLRMLTKDTSVLAAGRCTKVSGIIRGFALRMEFYFTQGKDGQKLKKDLRSKFAKQIDKLTEDLEEGLNELTEIHMLFAQHCRQCDS